MPRSLIVVASITLLASRDTSGQNGTWSIDQKPGLRIGQATSDGSVLFGGRLGGATRLPDRTVLVADPGEFNLKLFSPDGKLLKQLGRKGSGPGELASSVTNLYRCGDQILTWDRSRTVSAFGLDLKFRRSFQFGLPPTSWGIYSLATACNESSTFVHYGFEGAKDRKFGAFRANVDVWTTGADSVVKKVIGQFPGSERWGYGKDNQIRSTGPLLLGKQTALAISADRIFIGPADRYEIAVYDLDGKRVGTIQKPNVNLAVTKADVDVAIAREIAGIPDREQPGMLELLASMEIPKTLPAYIRMMVDSDNLLWVQDYPRTTSPTSRWTVFTAAGAQQAEVLLPANLMVYEIGRDYVLGKYVDPDEQIPEVRMYRLRRK